MSYHLASSLITPRRSDVSDVTYRNYRYATAPADTTHRDVSDMTYHRV